MGLNITVRLCCVFLKYAEHVLLKNNEELPSKYNNNDNRNGSVNV